MALARGSGCAAAPALPRRTLANGWSKGSPSSICPSCASNLWIARSPLVSLIGVKHMHKSPRALLHEGACEPDCPWSGHAQLH
eukprot:353182-Chlamydomonas_euryale.AAC.14